MSSQTALVLGGGGAAGNAWQIGLLAGLAAGGVHLGAWADVLVGTSAGATAAVQIASGTSLGTLYADIVTPRAAGSPAGAGAPARPHARHRLPSAFPPMSGPHGA